jgi:septum site-determining protein MinD
MLAVCGGKGGVGKTTTALAVARALAEEGDRPVVLDADVELPDLAALADVPAGDGVRQLARGTPLSSASHRDPHVRGLRVVPATPGTAPAAVTAALAHLLARPRPVVVDCPAGVGPDAAAPLRASSHALLVTRDTPASVGDAGKTARMAAALGTRVVGGFVTGTETPRLASAGLDGVSLCPVPTPPAAGDPIRTNLTDCEQMWGQIIGTFN